MDDEKIGALYVAPDTMNLRCTRCSAREDVPVAPNDRTQYSFQAVKHCPECGYFTMVPTACATDEEEAELLLELENIALNYCDDGC